ncbi:MAG: imidazole glycerol phosphate synthase subunit HisH [Balneolaceae bacterium]
MIGIIKYRSGNLASVSNALDRLRASYIISDRSEELDRCDAILFPGVGHASSAMEDLKSRNLDHWLRNTSKPVLGICLGMQLMYEFTEEGAVETLGVLPGRLQKFDSSRAKVPHMGWNQIDVIKTHPLFKGFRENHYYYFVHSYYAPMNEYTLASCEYIDKFSAVAAKNNFMGVQFHPEKSGEAGSLLLKNFLKITQRFIHKSL